MDTDDKTNHDETNEGLNQEKKAMGNDGFIHRFLAFIKKHFIIAILAVALIVVIIWYSAKNKATNERADNRETELILKHETERHTMQINNLEFASIVFSWAVRSELLRDNQENLNQLLTIFTQKSGADLVQLINPENKEILLSSDKKFEGTIYQKELNFNINESAIIEENNSVQILTPVMGFNTQIGILIVEKNKTLEK